MTVITKQQIDLKQVVSILGVSSATGKNWIKHNYLTPTKTSTGKFMFCLSEVATLQNKINSGDIDRLNTRANKRHSVASFIPKEYADNPETIQIIENIKTQYLANDWELHSTLFAILLNLLHQKNLISDCSDLKLSRIKKPLADELSWWLSTTKQNFSSSKYADLFQLSLPPANDFLGLVYQSLINEGEKAKGGSYYTPKKIVNEIVRTYLKPDFKILDPCCGTGQFLLASADIIQDPKQLWGFDIDEIAVHLARINLLLRFPEKDFTPNIQHLNTLTDLEPTLFSKNTPTFDAIITNPPWGYHFDISERQLLNKLYPSIKSGEAFSYFIYKSLSLLKDDGVLSFVLPEAMLNVNVHKDIRQYILNTTQILKISLLGRAFKKVFTPVIRIDLRKTLVELNHQVIISNSQKDYQIPQTMFQKDTTKIFNAFADDTSIKIINKMYDMPHTTLEKKAEWALGIVTGDNQKHLKDNSSDNAEPIIRGKEVDAFKIKAPQKYIHFVSEQLQQIAPESKYRTSEKLVYRFISRNLVFAYDNQKKLTLNSANVLIPQIPNYPIKTVLALFNSSAYQFLYRKRFNSIKILRGHLEKLPIPMLDKIMHKKIQVYVDALLKIEPSEATLLHKQLDDLVLSIFSFTQAEKTYIESQL